MAKILVVDDEPESLFLYEAIFSKGGYEVTCLASPIKAIERLKTEAFDLVISDYYMPQMNGLEFYRNIRKNKVYDGQFIFVTGRIETNQNSLKKEPGIIEVFHKPMPFNEILKFLNKNIRPAVVGKKLGPKKSQ